MIDSGMVSLSDVKAGRVSLADIMEAYHYLEMKADMEKYFMDKAREEAKHGKWSRKGAYR